MSDFDRRRRNQAGDIRAIIISPTRELAEQIATEALKVVGRTGLVVQTAVGGTQKREGLRNIQRKGCHILVGTPGRLIDIFSDPMSGVRAPNLSALVLDEADRLLDLGFAPAIEELQSYFPKRSEVDRQTLMFSATVPRSILGIVRNTMKKDFHFLNTIREDEVPTQLTVPQRLVYLRGMENQLPVLLEMAKSNVQKYEDDPQNNRPFKAIVYFNSTAEVSLAYNAFKALRDEPEEPTSSHPLPKLRLTEMHSRLTQAQRTRNSESFRRARSGILFSSDVTARGMDFPEVTHVIQFGVPQSRETYIHRLGRTARANKTGEGWLFCPAIDNNLVRYRLGDLPLKKDPGTLICPTVDMRNEQQTPEVASIIKQVVNSFRWIPKDEKVKVYLALLSNAHAVRDKSELVRIMNRLAVTGWGMKEIPSVSHRTAQKLGLLRVRELNIGESNTMDSYDEFPQRSQRPMTDGYQRRPNWSGNRGRSGSYGDRDHLAGRRRSFRGSSGYR